MKNFLNHFKPTKNSIVQGFLLGSSVAIFLVGFSTLFVSDFISSTSTIASIFGVSILGMHTFSRNSEILSEKEDQCLQEHSIDINKSAEVSAEIKLALSDKSCFDNTKIKAFSAEKLDSLNDNSI